MTTKQTTAAVRRPGSLLAFCLLIATTLLAQKSKKDDPQLPPFGSVSKAELQLTACDFDDKAEALALIDEGLLEFVIGRGMDMKCRVRIKILNNKGLDWANVHLKYITDRGLQSINGLEAQTYNLDAAGNVVVTKVDKAQFFEKKINKKVSEKAFTFPGVKVGSVIEYRYRHENMGLSDWYFQRSIPVSQSVFTIDFPQEIEFAATPFCNGQYKHTKKEEGTRNISVYTMARIPAFRNEPYTVNEDYYRDRLETKVTAYNINGNRTNRIINWVQVIKFLMADEDFGIQLKKEIPRTADLDEKLKGIGPAYEKMKCIYRYVQQNMQWNDYDGIWALDGVKSAWKDKKGTVGEINLILVNLLKDAGLAAHPVLVSTHDNGIVNTLDAGTYEYPGFHQFNKVMAYVEIDKKIYVLDATRKDQPPHLIPADVLLTQGMVIEKIETGDWGWHTLWQEAVAKNVVMLNAAIDESGKMKGSATITSYDYARLSRMGPAKQGKDKYIEAYVKENNPGLEVEDLKFENLEADSLPLVQKISFSQPLNAAGEYQYFSTNLLSGMEKNPFVADNRFSDVFFGTNRSLTVYANISLPDNLEFDVLPKNIKMIMPDTSIVMTRVAQVTENLLQAKIQVDFKRPVYEAEHYPELQDFFGRLIEMLNEQFVVRKKKKAQP